MFLIASIPSMMDFINEFIRYIYLLCYFYKTHLLNYYEMMRWRY